MEGKSNREPMLDMFLFESIQLIEQLEQKILESEKSKSFDSSAINEIFRIMHTIKGSAAMMLFNGISTLAHTVEDLFYFIREKKPEKIDYTRLSDMILECVDFIKNEIAKIEDGQKADGSPDNLMEKLKAYLAELKGGKAGSGDAEPKKNADSASSKFYISASKDKAQKSEEETEEHTYKAVIFFDDGCEMENIRSFSIVHNLKQMADVLDFTPPDIAENEQCSEIIKQNGFSVIFTTNISYETIKKHLEQTVFIKSLELEQIDGYGTSPKIIAAKPQAINLEDPTSEYLQKHQEPDHEKDMAQSYSKQSIISVNLQKLDKLMDLVGELVISEAMVTRNPELKDLELDGFYKAARQLRKITTELQDVVMSIRMVPLAPTFQKMNRLVRDMCKKLNKDVDLRLSGEETEVDKNIIEHISDPLMHLIRNSLDHGIETTEERIAKEKQAKGAISLEAKNAGGDVWIVVKDDGAGLNREKIMKKARENGLLNKADSEYSDRDVYSFILLPGFSTKEKVTEFSGRGVGMDVVTQNMEKIGGSIVIDSVPGSGTTISMKIPLTLAIIDGMEIKVGKNSYIVPTTAIKQSFKVSDKDIITDTEGNEMIMVRGECISVLRLQKLYDIKDGFERISDGIMILVETDERSLCLFADALLGEQQVVVKALPRYIKRVHGISGCTLLGNGSISLILDIGMLVEMLVRK